MAKQPSQPSYVDGWVPPNEFHEYRLVEPLGREPARVFLARDTLLERAVAVKFIPAASPEGMARLLNEARAAARVQHPNVVTVYRVGQLDDHAYIVTEYTRGISLDQLPKPQPSARVQRLAVDLVRGLAAAHRAGVLHRDLKPANAVLTEEGTVKLLDFGLAKLVAPLGARPRTPLGTLALAPTPPARGDLVGTPYYMSPEAWRGDDHTARSDLYSLGALLYELCSGRAPFRHVPLGELPHAVEHEAVVPLAELAPGIDPAFASAIERCLRADPLERFATAASLLDALETALGPTAGEVPEGNPYRGLRPFEPEHRAFFFGRSRDLRELRERLRGEPFVLLAGDSGVGKSSLAAAGLLPEVEAGALGGERAWRTARLVPGHFPLAALADALAPALGLDAVELESALRSEPADLARRLRARLRGDRGLLVFVDQLEELTTLAEPADAERLAVALASLAEGLPGVRLLATARSDFLTRLAALPALGAPLARAIHLVRPLDREDLREAVTGPARVKGVRYESEALVEELVTSASGAGGALPLLQFALAELWDRRDETARVIPAQALSALGGVSGALARHADRVTDALLPDQRKAARAVLLRLVTEDGTRARRTGEELTGRDSRHRAALEALVRGRLLVARDSDSGTTYELAHEALLQGWDRLARWLAEDAETRSVRRRLEAAALEWERLGHRPESLWGPQGVEDALALDPDLLAEREQRFLAASRQGLLRRRRVRIAAGLGVLGLIGLAAGAVQLRGHLERRGRVEAELGAARVAQARAAASLAREEALRAQAFADYDGARSEDGEHSWAQSLAEGVAADGQLSDVGEHLERASALANDDPEVHRELGAYLLQRALRADAQGRTDLRDLFVQSLAGVDLNGQLLQTFRAPARLTVHAEPGAKLRLSRYAANAEGRLVEQPVEAAVVGERPLELPPGSYLLRREGDHPARLPLLLRRGEDRAVSLGPAPALPQGFVFIPPGRFRFGSAAEESVRQFLATTPVHDLETGAYLIARTETTWAEYLAFLDDLPEPERAARTPRIATSNGARTFKLSKQAGRWSLALQPGSAPMSAVAGEKLHYPGRTQHADVDWLSLPVSGIDYDDALAYARWLDRTGRVPGAHLCTEVEWERAARGADEREFPHANRLQASDANIDVTYAREPRALGPDEVGSRPASVSPFGVYDMTGNVWEWTRSVLNPGDPILRGGSYFSDASTSRVTNRDTTDRAYTNMTLGMRMCADSPK
jgi:formylglycine-generating enzyme required for sulfatase activity